MLNVTVHARIELMTLLIKTLESKPATLLEGEDVAFRIVSSEGSLGLALDAPRQGDSTVEHEGWSVLLVDAMTWDILDGLTLDVVESEEGPSLALL